MSDVHTALECDSESARLLPWLVTGQLAADEAARVEAHVNTCPLCRADLEQQRNLRDCLRADDRVEYSPQPSLQRLMSRIDELDRELPAAASAGHGGTGAPVAGASSAGTQRWAPARWLVAALIVQTMGLGLLSTLLWGRSPLVANGTATYQTLTTPPALVDGATVPRLRVVFAPATPVDAMASLLRGVHASIVSGPTDAGAYALALAPSHSSIEASLAQLRADPRVVFAEPIVAATAPTAR
jgi:hypothetical protein